MHDSRSLQSQEVLVSPLQRGRFSSSMRARGNSFMIEVSLLISTAFRMSWSRPVSRRRLHMRLQRDESLWSPGSRD